MLGPLSDRSNVHHHWMPIWGRYHVRITVEKGTFHCPACDQEEPFKHKDVELKGHWFWIPCGEGKDKHEYVKCCCCKNHFQTAVLNDTTEEATSPKQEGKPAAEDETHNTDME